MEWIKIDVNCPTNPRVVAAGSRAAWLWVQALCWSAEHMTDGHIPTWMLLRISGEEDAHDLAARLVEVGLFETDDNGWTIHKYRDYQRTREEIEGQRAAWRGRQARHRAAGREASPVSHADVTPPVTPMSRRDTMRDIPVSHADVTHDVTPMSRRDTPRDIPVTHADVTETCHAGVTPLEVEVELDILSRDRPAADTRAEPFSADFADWWSAWPKKVDRKAAYRRYAARRREGVAAADLVAARDRYLAQLRDREYCKHGATFLSASDGPWSEFRDGPVPDTGEVAEDVLPPFLAISLVEEKLRARGVDVDVEVLAATVTTLGFTGRWYDNPATLDILVGAMVPETDAEFAW